MQRWSSFETATLARMPAMPLSFISHLQSALDKARPPLLAVAFSGGTDSTALLHALASLDAARAVGLRALHVDHGLHGDSARWAEHCVRVCDSLALPIQVLRIEVARDAGLGIEGAARQARYAALAAALMPGEWLATGQHQEDQAETLLLRLMRGSGTAGLSAMRVQRPLSPGTLWRPLLEVPRAQLREYAQAHQLSVIEDPSNRDQRFDRSWLRSEVMPLLRRRWPQAEARIADSATLLAADADLIEQQAIDALSACRDRNNDAALSIDRLLDLSAPLRAHVLRRWLRELQADPLPRRLLQRIEADLLGETCSAQAEVRYAGTLIRRYRGSLFSDRLMDDRMCAPNDRGWSCEWDGRAPLTLPDGSQLAFSAHWPGPNLRVGYRQGGERIRLPGRDHHHELKDLLQDASIPPWRRGRLPLIWSPEGELLAVGDLLRAASFNSACARAGVALIWTQSARR